MVSVNDLIADKLVSHQIGLQRLSNRTVRKILRMLSVSDRRIAERLLDGDITELSRRRQEKLLGQIRDIISEIHDDATGALRKELSDLAEYEGEFQLNLLQRSVGVTVDFASVSADQIVAAATSKPFQGKYLKEWGQDLAAATFRRVRDAVRLGIVEQRTTAEIVRDLRGTRRQGYKDGLLAIDKRNAEAVVRTAVNHTANAARQRLYDRNKRLIKGVQILATLDTRTSKICMGADNRIAVGEGYTKADFPKGTRFLDELPNMTNESRPPFHINSVVEGTLIATDAGLVPIEHVSVGTKVLTHCGRYKPVTSVICKPKDTKTIRLVCDNGSGISLSDDHPVLTLGRGWINAGDVKIGDVLAQDTEQLSTLPNSIRPPAEVPQAVLSNAHSMETSCREELISLGIFSLSAGMTSAVNLKQDIPDFEIGDVSKKWNLKGKLHTSGIKNINHAGLVACGVGGKGCGLPLSYLWDMQGVSGGVLGLHSLGRGFSNFGCKIRVFLGPVVAAGRARYMLGADSNGFVSSPNSYAVFLAGVVKACFAKAKLALNVSKGMPFVPMFGFNDAGNKVFGKHGGSFSGWSAATTISNAEIKYSGLMYNLSVEEDETYVADGLVVHNCRTTTTPVLRSLTELGLKEVKGTRASMDGQVPSDMTYSDWLKKQSEDVQDDVLGKGKAELFRKGEPIERFINEKGKEVTLDQLRASER